MGKETSREGNRNYPRDWMWDVITPVAVAATLAAGALWFVSKMMGVAIKDAEKSAVKAPENPGKQR